MQNPEVRYVVRDGARIAFGVFGSGPIDLVVHKSGSSFPIDLMWDLPQLAQFMEALGGLARVIVYDDRGHGASDPLPTTDGSAGVESGAADLLAVLDAVGADRVSILSFNLGATEIFTAATYPERVRSMIGANLRASFPEMRGTSFEEREAVAAWLATPKGLALFNPRVAHDPLLQQWWTRAHRLDASPSEFAKTMEYAAHLDAESLVGSVRAPTLVFHRRESPYWDIETSRATAARLPNGRFVEMPGSESELFLGDTGPVLAEIAKFLRDEEAPDLDDRTLATVIFTDIVASTEQLAGMGDKSWRRVLDEHDGIVERAVSEFRGKVIKKLGDGVLATFDGPARAVRSAAKIRDMVDTNGISVRAGLHTGEVELRNGDVAGLAVHVASRISGLADAGEILTSRTVVDLTSGSGITYVNRGQHTLKGIPGSWPIFAATAPAATGL